MSETMVERVARAIYESQYWARPKDVDWTDVQRAGYMKDARAAIAAMREPTEGMMHVMTALAPTWDDETSRRKWSAAIDAALKERVSEPLGKS